MDGRGTPTTGDRHRLREAGIADLVGLGAGLDDAAEAIDDLLTRYAEAHRRYHTAEHLAETLDRADELGGWAARPALVRLALWWHDAVYAPAPGADEEASATLAERALTDLGVGEDLAREVGRLVRLTAAHELVDPGDRDGAVVLDADLAVLAADPARYDRYVDDVRHEYAAVGDAAWRRGRAGVLRTFLARSPIFTTGGLGTAAEGRARANLARELAALTGGRADPRARGPAGPARPTSPVEPRP